MPTVVGDHSHRVGRAAVSIPDMAILAITGALLEVVGAIKGGHVPFVTNHLAIIHYRVVELVVELHLGRSPWRYVNSS